jgi:hypothetical protein
MHILFGALAGAAFAMVSVTAFVLIAGKTPTWKAVLLAGLGGAIAGAVTTATLGAGGVASASLGREAVSFALGGASGGGVERAVENVVEGRPIQKGVVKSVGFGAGVGMVSLGAGKALRHVTGKVFPSWTDPDAPSSFLSRLFGSSTPGTGGSWLRSARVPGTGAGVVSTFEDEAPDEGLGATTTTTTQAASTSVAQSFEAPEESLPAPPSTKRPQQRTRRGLSGAFSR